MRIRLLVTALATAGLVASVAPARATGGPEILMSNFRFCPAANRPIPCDPADIG